MLAPGEKFVVAQARLKGRYLRTFLRESRKVITAESDEEKDRLLSKLPKSWGVRQHIAFFVFTNLRTLGPSIVWWPIVAIILYMVAIVGPFLFG
jgi:hypothetical protein